MVSMGSEVAGMWLDMMADADAHTGDDRAELSMLQQLDQVLLDFCRRDPDNGVRLMRCVCACACVCAVCVRACACGDMTWDMLVI